jgi:CO/xanthine dehydrogenase FAD-binding subunit
LPVFRPNEFLLSKDKNEVIQKLKSEGKRAHIIAGGTGFYELAKRGYIPEVKSIVSIMQLGLAYIREDSNQLVIGATTTLQEMLESGIGERVGFEAIGEALREIHPVQVRNVATIGGEICISVPVVDLPTALLACDATIKVLRDDQEYETKLVDFFIDAFLTKLDYGEVVKEVSLPKHSSGNFHSAFVKIGRASYDFNLINCAVLISSNPSSKKLDSMNIYLGGINRKPIRASEVEKKLLGKVPDERTILDAARSAFSKTNLLPSVHGSNEYKHELLPIIVRDCVMKAYERSLAS